MSAGQRILSVQNGLKSSPMSHVSKRRFWLNFVLTSAQVFDECIHVERLLLLQKYTLHNYYLHKHDKWQMLLNFHYTFQYIYILIDSFKDWTAKSWNNVTVVIFKLKQWYFFAFLTFLTVCFLCVLCRRYVPQCLMYQRAHD